MTNFIINTEDRKSSIKEIYTSVKDGDIILNPEYQRNYVYDVKRASKVIESILLEIPLPAIFANEEQDGSMEIIDGVQRITSIIKFINGEYKLTGLDILSEYNNKTFKNFTEEQKRIFRQKSLRIIKFKKDCSENIKFEIFLRLNQGSVNLNNQELRNCMYRGYFNDKIKEIAKLPIITQMFKFDANKIDRYLIEEYILRGLVFLNYDSLIKKKFLNNNMNELMRMFKNDKESVDKIVREYLEILNKIKSILGKNAFRHDFLNDGKFIAAHHDSLLLVFKEYSKHSLIANKDKIKKAFKEEFKTNSFIELTKSQSSNYKNVSLRATLLSEAISNLIIELDPKRNFTQKEKEELYKISNICAICNNVIDDIKDANVDHIIPWSKGGKTTLENAQLTHEFCNKSKGDNI